LYPFFIPNNMKNLIIIIAIFISANSLGQIKGKVIAVHDGDTFTLLTDDSNTIKVRLHAVDCPELKQDYGDSAKIFTTNMILDKHVEVERIVLDKYRRTVGLVYIDSVILNEELIKAGLAWHYLKYDKNARLDRIQELAVKQKLGLWKLAIPVAPWDYRHR
jgi:micrococcal nuclease